MADVLVGSAPGFTGLLPTLLGRHDNPWFLSREGVLAVLLAVVVLPMLLARDLKVVAKFSMFSTAMVAILAVTLFTLAATAVWEGKVASGVRLLPEAAAMGDGTPLGILTSILTVVSGGVGGRAPVQQRSGSMHAPIGEPRHPGPPGSSAPAGLPPPTPPCSPPAPTCCSQLPGFDLPLQPAAGEVVAEEPQLEQHAACDSNFGAGVRRHLLCGGRQRCAGGGGGRAVACACACSWGCLRKAMPAPSPSFPPYSCVSCCLQATPFSAL